ncbi:MULTISPECIES: energy transducer TonB [unclassified Hahella]|uniref:energy transducer TonB n=1 Tax=unclassified Hahella TaxID=2624107 RepID=UPI001C1ED1E4|nr:MULTISPECIES: energy transducer TonB [unclassified Hahella]MBU6953106.1 energy transducer TonB [Hahella sp. HN01]MDG9669904.1 energy transducer TonB [Hahella sp. CR1]
MKFRFAAALGLALITVLGLFRLMDQLIHNDGKELADKDDIGMIDFVRVQKEDPVKERKRELPKPPPPKRPPPPPEMKTTQSAVRPQTPQLKVDMPRVDANLGLALGQMGQVGMAASSAGDSGVIGKATFPPDFPREAARAGIEGWVEVEFTVNAQGRVEDIKVVASEPRKIFDKAAKQCISKWTFKPAMVDGKAVATRARQRIDFTL